MIDVSLGRNHRWAHAKAGRPERQVLTWENPDGSTSSVSASEPTVIEWVVAGGVVIASESPEQDPLTPSLVDLERRLAALEAKKGA